MNINRPKVKFYSLYKHAPALLENKNLTQKDVEMVGDFFIQELKKFVRSEDATFFARGIGTFTHKLTTLQAEIARLTTFFNRRIVGDIPATDYRTYGPELNYEKKLKEFRILHNKLEKVTKSFVKAKRYGFYKERLQQSEIDLRRAEEFVNQKRARRGDCEREENNL